MSEPWGLLFTKDTPAAELPLIIQRVIDDCVADFTARLNAEPDLSDADRAYALTVGTRAIVDETTKTLTDGWLRLQRTQ
jgi:hypothetical protein